MNIPLYNSIKKYIDSMPTVFHMPGHKLGKGIPETFLYNIAQLDLTEIPGTDNLHFPSEAIKDAQEIASEAFGADKTFFLVNGSTCGIHAMIMAVCKPGDRMIVSRDCHKAVINGLILAGAEPIYLKPTFEMKFGIPGAILPGDIENALLKNPDVVGILITRPNYYGICSDIEDIARVVHKYGKILLVDEAHGSHLKFNEALPECAMSAGADICVQSAHKTLPALTQGAYLHVKGSSIDMERLEFYLRLLQTTSPSYIIMAFLDIARFIMQTNGRELLEKLMSNIDWFNYKVSNLSDIAILNGNGLNTGELDKTRVVINVKELGLKGFSVERILREQYNIQVEMSDMYNIVCIGTVADSRGQYELLFKAVKELKDKFKDREYSSDKYIDCMSIPEMSFELAKIPVTKGKWVKLEDSEGSICRSMITPYPPGIPVVCPGEKIQADIIEYIYRIINFGGTVNGLEDGYINVIE